MNDIINYRTYVCSSLLAFLIDFLRLLENVSWTRSTMSRKWRCFSICDTKVLVANRILFHWWVNFAVGGSIFHSVRTSRWTRVTNFNSTNQSTHCRLFLWRPYLWKWNSRNKFFAIILTIISMRNWTVQTNTSWRDLQSMNEQSITICWVVLS